MASTPNLNLNDPVFVVVHPSDTKNFAHYYQGEGAYEEAVAQAEALAKSTGRPAIVMGPQTDIVLPPAKTTIRQKPAFV